jgi:HAD superfamily hydrolase (TIGR01490 family)
MTPTQAPTRLALFDLDHTLLPLDSDYHWADFLARHGHNGDPATARATNDAIMQRYDEGKLSATESAEFMLGMLARNTPYDLARWHETFMAEVIRPAITPQAIELVRNHLEAGDLCVVATSTNSFVVGPIVRAFGITHLLATDPEYVNGRYTGRFVGAACFREGKVTRLDAWLKTLGRDLASFDESVFYSDSMNDVPLLEVVTTPVATNPSPTLRALAQERNWRITDLFA